MAQTNDTSATMPPTPIKIEFGSLIPTQSTKTALFNTALADANLEAMTAWHGELTLSMAL